MSEYAKKELIASICLFMILFSLVMGFIHHVKKDPSLDSGLYVIQLGEQYLYLEDGSSERQSTIINDPLEATKFDDAEFANKEAKKLGGKTYQIVLVPEK